MHKDEFTSELEELSGKLLLKVGGISDRDPTAEQWANTFQDVTPQTALCQICSCWWRR